MSDGGGAGQPAGVKSASRALDIFELLSGEARWLTISEISARLGFARSSTHGLVHTLFSRGYLAMDDHNRFGLGVRLIELGLKVVDRLELRTAARGPLEQLVASTHDTALLVVPEHGELLYADRVVSGSREIRTDPRVSTRAPLHCSSLGKALLAALDEDALRRILGQGPLEGVTEHSITDPEALLADLASTRARGYAIDTQEAVQGVWCVGAPIRDHTGRLIAAISVSTIREFFDPVLAGPLVAGAAVEISTAMGWLGDVTTLYDGVPGAESLLVGETERIAVGG